MQLDTLQQTVHGLRRVVLVGVSISALAAIGMGVIAYRSQSLIEQVARERPIMVVPGAVAGAYISGLSEDNLTGVARYIASLATNFTPANYADRSAELLSYADATILPTLSAAQARLSQEVVATSQARYFFADKKSESLKQIGASVYQYSATGDRTVLAAGIPVSQDKATIQVTFALGTASNANRYGFQLRALNISEPDVVARRPPPVGVPR